MSGEFKSARDAWNEIHGSTSRARAVRRDIKERFRLCFPNGHEHSLRTYVISRANHALAGGSFKESSVSNKLEQAHPRALYLLGLYGSDYRPGSWKKYKPQNIAVQPQMGRCAYNSHFLRDIRNEARRRGVRWVHVEGIAMCPRVALPMLHAWNAAGLTSSLAMDWTWYAATEWTRYFGIPLTGQQYEKCRDLAGHSESTYRMLFDKDTFPKVEEYLEKILADRVN
jgi:hypothetical protein